MSAEEFVLLDVCREAKALGLGCRADRPEAICVGLAMDMQGNRVCNAGEPEADGDLVTRGYADRFYGGLRLLWQNPAPGSAFGTQKVEVDLSGHRFVMVTARYDASAEICSSELCPVGLEGQCKILSGGSLAGRSFQVDEDGVVFGSGSSGDGYAIPLRIYGM